MFLHFFWEFKPSRSYKPGSYEKEKKNVTFSACTMESVKKNRTTDLTGVYPKNGA